MTALVIVDSGCANVGSVRFAFERLGASPQVTRDPARIRAAGRVVLPGVGSAQHAMGSLRRLDLIDLLKSLEQPVLGICLGMQILFDRSEEGDTAGLGVMPGECRKLGPGVRVPHMGWSRLGMVTEDPLLKHVANGSYGYFVHSFAVEPTAACVATAEHGRAFAAVVRHNNYCGAQFHPERSGKTGARILQNFLDS